LGTLHELLASSNRTGQFADLLSEVGRDNASDARRLLRVEGVHAIQDLTEGGFGDQLKALLMRDGVLSRHLCHGLEVGVGNRLKDRFVEGHKPIAMRCWRPPGGSSTSTLQVFPWGSDWASLTGCLDRLAVLEDTCAPRPGDPKKSRTFQELFGL
jgi:hypothetical protein